MEKEFTRSQRTQLGEKNFSRSYTKQGVKTLNFQNFQNFKLPKTEVNLKTQTHAKFTTEKGNLKKTYNQELRSTQKILKFLNTLRKPKFLKTWKTRKILTTQVHISVLIALLNRQNLHLDKLRLNFKQKATGGLDQISDKTTS